MARHRERLADQWEIAAVHLTDVPVDRGVLAQH